MSGLQIKAADFAKIGQMVLQKGMWDGKQVVSEQWINLSFAPGSSLFKNCGLLWWLRSDPVDSKFFYDDALLEKYEVAGIPEQYIVRLRTIVGLFYNRGEMRSKLVETLGGETALIDFLAQTTAKGVPQVNVKDGPAKAFSAEGYLGQFLIIIPEKNIVGVRQIHYLSSGEDTQFDDFGSLLMQMQ